MLERVVEDSVRVLGSDHPDTLTSRHILVGTYQAAGRPEDAEKLLEHWPSGS
ncbi:tetratricopeptide repeat protein [Actinomyces sp. Z3]|uniref:tetratricopeptide repeat protein n=1 Tax=Actinomyces sp. Z3 TaxID=2250217 RepID=UPI0037BFB3E2